MMLVVNCFDVQLIDSLYAISRQSLIHTKHDMHVPNYSDDNNVREYLMHFFLRVEQITHHSKSRSLIITFSINRG